ncbi:MAG: hypothetical protein GIW96_06815 [Candidatus Eremiobacteraeota bacterium]|nr:hypothetical protein [Candidatus Eremiobacteraeota bacterium]
MLHEIEIIVTPLQCSEDGLNLGIARTSHHAWQLAVLQVIDVRLLDTSRDAEDPASLGRHIRLSHVQMQSSTLQYKADIS